MAAEVEEEILLGTDPGKLEDFGPDAGDPLLQRRLRRRCRLGRLRHQRGCRLGELLAVHLAAREHGQCREHVEVGGHHVGRQPRAQRLENLIAVERARLLAQDDVRGERRHALAIVKPDGCAPDLRMLQQHRLDLGELHAVAANFHLAVDAAEEFEIALLVDAREVSGAVEPRVVERHERARGHFRLVEIAARDARAADVELALGAARHGLHLRVEDQRGVALDGTPDGDRPPGLQHRSGGVDRGFRGSIDVEHQAPRLDPARDKLGRAGFPAHHQLAQRRHVLRDGRQQRRHGREIRDAGLGEVAGKVVAELRRVLAPDHQGGAVRERHPDLLHGAVEAEREALVDAILVRGGARVVEGRDEVRDVAVLGHDALGAAGGAGRVEHVADIRRHHAGVRARQAALGLGGDALGRLVERDDGARDQTRDARLQSLLRQHDLDAGLADDEAHAVVGIGRIERHVGAARFENRKDGDDRQLRALEAKPDERSGADAKRAKVARQAVGPGFEPGIAEHEIAPNERRRLTSCVGLRLEQLVQASRFAGLRRRERTISPGGGLDLQRHLCSPQQQSLIGGRCKICAVNRQKRSLLKVG